MNICFVKKHKKKPETRIYITCDSHLSVTMNRYCYGLKKIDRADNAIRLYEYFGDNKKLEDTLKCLNECQQWIDKVNKKGYVFAWSQS
jgi:hypothetical protein